MARPPPSLLPFSQQLAQPAKTIAEKEPFVSSDAQEGFIH